MMHEFNFLSIGMSFIFIGIAIIFLGILFTSLRQKQSPSSLKVSFFGLIGPIPFGFSNDRKLFIFTLITAIAIMLLIIFFFQRGHV